MYASSVSSFSSFSFQLTSHDELIMTAKRWTHSAGTLSKYFNIHTDAQIIKIFNDAEKQAMLKMTRSTQYRTLQEYISILEPFCGLYSNDSCKSISSLIETCLSKTTGLALHGIYNTTNAYNTLISNQNIHDLENELGFGLNGQCVDQIQQDHDSLLFEDLGVSNILTAFSMHCMQLFAIDERLELFIDPAKFNDILHIYQQFKQYKTDDKYNWKTQCDFLDCVGQHQPQVPFEKISNVLPCSFWYDTMSILDLMYSYGMDCHDNHQTSVSIVNGYSDNIRYQWVKRYVDACIAFVNGTLMENEYYAMNNVDIGSKSIHDEYARFRAYSAAGETFAAILCLCHNINISDELYDRFIINNKFGQQCSLILGIFNDMEFGNKDTEMYQTASNINGHDHCLSSSLNMDDEVLLLAKSTQIARNRMLAIKKYATMDNYMATVCGVRDIMHKTYQELRQLNECNKISLDEMKNVVKIQILSLLCVYSLNQWQIRSPRYNIFANA